MDLTFGKPEIYQDVFLFFIFLTSLVFSLFTKETEDHKKFTQIEKSIKDFPILEV